MSRDRQRIWPQRPSRTSKIMKSNSRQIMRKWTTSSSDRLRRLIARLKVNLFSAEKLVNIISPASIRDVIFILVFTPGEVTIAGSCTCLLHFGEASLCPALIKAGKRRLRATAVCNNILMSWMSMVYRWPFSRAGHIDVLEINCQMNLTALYLFVPPP